LARDGIAQMVAKKPDRLRGMATLPMQDPDAAITELERVVEEYAALRQWNWAPP
jgi:aminocarboxymuconate-semialdehyde decarboxylase